MDEDITVKNGVLCILNFKASEYAWYMEMYFGLFLIIPFLNLIWNNLQKKGGGVLLLSMVVLTAIPGIVNIYNFSIAGWWSNPTLSSEYSKILPSFWTGLYPITYYFIGCYIYDNRENQEKHIVRDVFALIATVILFGSFCYYRSYGNTFEWGPWQQWEALPVVMMSYFVFRILKNFSFEGMPVFLQKAFQVVSDACLGGYLLSFIFDNLYYGKLNRAIADCRTRSHYYFIMVIIVFISCILCSIVINMIYKYVFQTFTRKKR